MSATPAVRRPHVLLICVEHWSGRYLGIDGHPCIRTPTLDSLATNGVRFTNACSTTPSCIPARRSLMTGTLPRTHGDRIFKEEEPMPALPTLASTFAAAGYHTQAIGKLHVYPQRDRIGFHEALIHEEGRRHLGMAGDDYNMAVAAAGFAGAEYAHGVSANDYMSRAWHLPEELHPTNWTVRETCRAIRRRDPTRPCFWFMSFSAPHPPLVPPAAYLARYAPEPMDPAFTGSWPHDQETRPYALRLRRGGSYQQGHASFSDRATLAEARCAYYAACTHIDHQIRLAIGTLREEGLLDDTIVMFIADHGEMLGNHGLFAKDVLYEDSARIPMIIVPTAGDSRWSGPADTATGVASRPATDDRLADICDVMPTLLDLAGIDIPDSVEGRSLCGDDSRALLYGEHWEDDRATRMVRDHHYKLIYYPVGNRLQLFDLVDDPDELHDVASQRAMTPHRERLTAALIERLYGDDQEWVADGTLIGRPEPPFVPVPDRGIGGQRGWRFV